MNKQRNSRIGILGGIGPLASSRFIENIYRNNVHKFDCEQEMPCVFLYSDPSIPDRTEYLLSGRSKILYKPVIKALESLIKLGADKIIICCYTLHCLTHDMPSKVRDKIIPLPFVALNEVINKKSPSLLLCTRGSKTLGVFEEEKNWNEAKNYVIKPSTEDQDKIHSFIYDIKKYKNLQLGETFILELMKKYNASYWISGCTELYLLTGPNTILHKHTIDSLNILSNNIMKYTSDPIQL